MQNRSIRIFAVIMVLIAIMFLSGVLLLGRWFEPDAPKPSHSDANAELIRAARLNDQLAPLVERAAKIVSILNSNYGPLLNTWPKMGVGVLVYLTTYYVVVEKASLFGTGAFISHPVHYRVANEAAAEQFFLPMHLIDSEYLRPVYWEHLKYRR